MQKYPYNDPLPGFGSSGFPVVFDETFRPAGDKKDGWIEWDIQPPPHGVLLQITYDFRNYPWHCTAEELECGQVHDLWWRMTGIGKEHMAK